MATVAPSGMSLTASSGDPTTLFMTVLRSSAPLGRRGGSKCIEHWTSTASGKSLTIGECYTSTGRRRSMSTRVILTYADLAGLPDDGKRYELHEGEISV